MSKNRTLKAFEKMLTEAPAFEKDPAGKADRRPAAQDRNVGVGVDHDPSQVIWFLD